MKVFKLCLFISFPRFLGSLNAISQWWFVLETNVHFPKPVARICKILLSVFSKARAVLAWAEPHLSIANKETPILGCKCAVDIEIATKNFFPFQVCQLYISFGLPVQKMSSLLCAGATCINSWGHKWGKSSRGGNVKVNDCWRKGCMWPRRHSLSRGKSS